MSANKPKIAIIGAGIGGLTLAASLQRFGFSIDIYEQAPQFAPIGAGIQLTANAMKALGGLGLLEVIRGAGFAPSAFHSREWDTAAITNILTMGETLEKRYGAPDLMVHRARLHAALAKLVPEACVHFGKKLSGVDRSASTVRLTFTDGSAAQADIVVGADGIHSAVRGALFAREAPQYTGRVAYRTTFPTALIGEKEIDERSKWWGPDRHVVHYFTTPNCDEIYFIAVAPEPDFQIESWSAKGESDVLLAAFDGCHPRLRAILAAAPELRKWALVEHDPMPSWGDDHVVLLGDACHPMPPFMAQGAAGAMEDAVVLARCLDAYEPAAALKIYARHRQQRTALMQTINRENTWLRFKTDTDWVYDYNAWTAPLDASALVPALTVS